MGDVEGFPYLIVGVIVSGLALPFLGIDLIGVAASAAFVLGLMSIGYSFYLWRG